MGSILGVGHLDPGSGPRIRGLDRFGVDFGPFQMMHPEITPKWTQFGVYFGVSSSTGIIKGPNPVYLGMYRIGPD